MSERSNRCSFFNSSLICYLLNRFCVSDGVQKKAQLVAHCKHEKTKAKAKQVKERSKCIFISTFMEFKRHFDPSCSYGFDGTSELNAVLLFPHDANACMYFCIYVCMHMNIRIQEYMITFLYECRDIGMNEYIYIHIYMMHACISLKQMLEWLCPCSMGMNAYHRLQLVKRRAGQEVMEVRRPVKKNAARGRKGAKRKQQQLLKRIVDATCSFTIPSCIENSSDGTTELLTPLAALPFPRVQKTEAMALRN